MKCPQCSSLKNSVVDSRLTDNNTAIRRRRHCEECQSRFTTFERLRAANLIVIKKDHTREEYDREKLERGIWRACEKRPLQQEAVSSMLSRLEEKWAEQNKEIPTSQIGDDILEALKGLDPVAYIRFASVYKAFSDVKSFEEIIEKIS